jgi:hypothetical protein
MATQYTAGLVQGQKNTAAIMNSIGAAWESYTPTWKQGTTTITHTVNYAKYSRINKNVVVEVRLTSTGTGAAGGALNVTLPTGLDCVSSADTRVVGTLLFQNATAFYVGAAVAPTATTINGLAYGGTGYMGFNAPAATVASGDVIAFSVTYEIA